MAQSRKRSLKGVVKEVEMVQQGKRSVEKALKKILENGENLNKSVENT